MISSINFPPFREWYKGFKNDCPDGQLHRAKIEEIYSMILPDGNSSSFVDKVIWIQLKIKFSEVEILGSVELNNLFYGISSLKRQRSQTCTLYCHFISDYVHQVLELTLKPHNIISPKVNRISRTFCP